MTSIYLHIPFCESKCVYCDFNSYAGLDALHAGFVDAICADIARGVERERLTDLAPAPAGTRDAAEVGVVETIFLGGGTPSVLPPAAIGRILETVARHYDVAADAEISMEANPGTISEANFRGYRAAGINRLSMGVQSFNDAHLQAIGRIHTAAEAVDAYERARRAGFTNINLDFIFGLPGQDLADWEATLRQAAALGTDHLSCYSLIVEEHTPLWLRVEQGEVVVPDEDAVADMYELTQATLGDTYTQYEISNWATRGHECRHNLVYWQARPYLGFGPGAHGYFGGRRYWTVLSPKKYIGALATGGSAVAGAEWIDPDLAMGEFMMLGLRTLAGIRPSEFARRFGRPFEAVYGSTAGQLRDWGLLEVEPARDVVRLTNRGLLLGNEVFARFLPD
ncbi:MAG TPA: radical SAM family heme chaperone HemW [Chloroflexia bacterium]|nr:radical SAM family heme chaperone HemW [Chloroflexia bacterium]